MISLNVITYCVASITDILKAVAPSFENITAKDLRVCLHECLRDSEIDLILNLVALKAGFDMQSCNKALTKFYPATDPSVQILHDATRKHWVCVYLEKEKVYYADSYNLTVNKTIQKQLRELYSRFAVNGQLQLVRLAVQQQQNTLDCRVFAAAFAFHFAKNILPSKVCYDVSKMRVHLVKCLANNKLELFPVDPKGVAQFSDERVDTIDFKEIA